MFAVSVNRYDNTVVAMGECVRMEHWWNHTDRAVLNYLKKRHSQCPFVHQTSHIVWSGIEPDPPGERSASYHLSNATALICVFRLAG